MEFWEMEFWLCGVDELKVDRGFTPRWVVNLRLAPKMLSAITQARRAHCRLSGLTG
jgi:hypothetical protein